MSRSKFNILDSLWILLMAFILAVLVKEILFPTFQVEGNSMLPTLRQGDLILCVKPFLFQKHRLRSADKAALASGGVRDGDIVVFKPSTFPDTEYVKRVISVGGEDLTIRDRKVMIQGELLKEPYLLTDKAPGIDEDIDFNTPPGFVFVMGDNRRYSRDSRIIGPVAASNIEGKCIAIYWPLDHFRIFP